MNGAGASIHASAGVFFLSCHVKQVQLVYSGTSLSRVGGAGGGGCLAPAKCSGFQLRKAIRKRSFDSAVSLRQPDPQDLHQGMNVWGCVNVEGEKTQPGARKC